MYVHLLLNADEVQIDMNPMGS